jgi:hypothetical protein
MAELHNALTGYPKLLEAFRRAIGETSPAFTGIERAGETLTPTMDLWALPEWALLRGEVLFARSVSVAAAAALFSSIELVNPTGSGVLVNVLAIASFGTSVNTNVDSGAALGAIATTQGVALDTRFPQLGAVSRATVTTGQLAAGAALPQDTLAQNMRSTTPYIIVPGKKLFIAPLAVNLVNLCALVWSERPLLPGEGAI